MKKVLLPTDFSANAWNAISYALQLLKDEECTFYFLHTYVPPFYRMDYMVGGPAFSGLPDAMLDISLTGLDKTLKDVQEEFPNEKHTFKKIASFNMLSDEVNEVTERENIDFIVMGTQGATGAKQIFLGTNTVFVLRKAKVPVLVIPENYHYKGIKQILFPSDYRTLYKRRELKVLVNLAKSHHASITSLHVTSEGELTEAQKRHREALKDFLEGVECKCKELYKQLMPQAVYDYLSVNDYQMLAMMNRKHSFLERVLLKQNVDDIGFHIDIPFLVLPDTSRITD
ncbi:universal stress protein [Ascidiimonas sp. W6]|uniref:universal stress protein n=1 Tax=Ascidiimonas meishanensis TaxID=3128903 RepID=UPI0030ED1574